MARPKTIKNGYTKDQLKDLIKKSQFMQIRALLLVYSKQTEAEQSERAAIDLNGVGFTGVHANYLSSLAEQVQQWGLSIEMPKSEFVELYKKIVENKRTGKSKLGILSPKQFQHLGKLIPQYTNQIWGFMPKVDTGA